MHPSEKDDVIDNIRSLLLSEKGGTRLERINKDYRSIIGENIPYRKLGYPSLEEFLQDVPGLLVNRDIRDGGYLVSVRPTDKTEHLAKLIARQKSTKKKPLPRRPIVRSSGPPANRPSYPNRTPYQTPRPMPPRPRPMPPMSAPNSQNVQPPQNRPANIPPLFSVPKNGQSTPRPLVSSQNSSQQQPTPPKTSENKPQGAPLSSQAPPIQQPAATAKAPMQNPAASVPVRPKVEPQSPVNNQPPRAQGSPTRHSLPSQPTRSQGTSLYTPAPTTLEEDPRVTLERLVTKIMKLEPPVYKKKESGRKIFGSVQVADKEYTSYPNESKDEQEAYRHAAKNALETLLETVGHGVGLKETTDADLIKARVSALIEEHAPRGIFSHELPNFYTQKHNEHLPRNWEQIIRTDESIVWEEAVKTVILSKTSWNQSSASPVLVEENFKESWPLRITHVENVQDMCARFVDDQSNSKIEKLTDQMTTHYRQQKSNSVIPEIGGLYAICFDDDWHRVICVARNDESKIAKVQFVDYGDYDVFAFSEFHLLLEDFTKLPKQTFKISLYGLEELENFPSILPLIEKFIDVTLWAQIKEKKSDKLVVELYDTESSTDVKLNDLVMQQFYEILNAATKKELKKGICDVRISHVTENGVFFQIQTQELIELENLVQRMAENGSSVSVSSNDQEINILLGKLYFVFDLKESKWFRGRAVEECQRQSLVKVQLIDTGKVIKVGKANMFLIEESSQILSEYPAQAISVTLNGLPKLTAPQIEKIESQTSEGSVLAKIISSDPIKVELFKKLESGGFLGSINQTLLDEARSNDTNNNALKSKKRIERIASRSKCQLKTPTIPPVNDCFDVSVSLVSNPFNFFVQPFNTKADLQTLMEHLKVLMESEKSNLIPEDIESDGVYATFSNGLWYRVRVLHKLSEGLVSALFTDFGDIKLLETDQLYILDSRFYDLPCQAINAKLQGLKPVNVDWTNEDCQYFARLIDKKDFVSIIQECDTKENPPVISVKLYDTSGSEDVCINDILVQQKRALAV